ncbi:serine/threonine-protein kinase atr-like isoform X2 [Brevipalpus obovatus]|uniref:serine/threonine-protein kinase atr-like isoform X2 n=1 Tax=Brevipalpus obovatus TaxID=246614 RepID=UPI003D9DE5CD
MDEKLHDELLQELYTFYHDKFYMHLCEVANDGKQIDNDFWDFVRKFIVIAFKKGGRDPNQSKAGENLPTRPDFSNVSENIKEKLRCLAKWLMKVFLALFMRFSDRKDDEIIGELRRAFVWLINILNARQDEQELMLYLMKELKLILSDLPSCSQSLKRGFHYNINHLLSESESASKSTNDDRIALHSSYMDVPLVINSLEELQNIFINLCKFLKVIGKIPAKFLGMEDYCSLLWKILHSTTSLSVPMAISALDLFISQYPNEWIHLGVGEGFMGYIVILTKSLLKSETFTDDFDELISLVISGWDLISKRLHVERNYNPQNGEIRPKSNLLEIFKAMIAMFEEKSVPKDSTMYRLIFSTLPQVFHEICDVMYRKNDIDQDCLKKMQYQILLEDSTSSSARIALARVAAFKKFTLLEFHELYAAQIVPDLTLWLMREFPDNPGEIYNCMCRFVSLYSGDPVNIEDKSKFMTLTLPYIFATIVSQPTEEAKNLLRVFKESLKVDSKTLVQIYSGKIPEALIKLPSTFAINQSLDYLKSIDDTQESLEHFCIQVLFVAHHNTRNAGFILYKLLVKDLICDPKVNYFNRNLSAHVPFAVYLIQMNKTLRKFNQTLTHSSRPLLEAVSSLATILDIVSRQQLSDFKLNIMGLLELAQKKSNGEIHIMNKIFNAWTKFLRICPPSELQPHLVVICKDLLPFFTLENPEKVVKLVHGFIFSDPKYCDEHLKHLHFLPEIRGMEEVWRLIRPELDFLQHSLSQDPVHQLRKSLKVFTALLQQASNPEVKVHHLEKLKIVLSYNQKALRFLCIPDKGSSTDQCLASLIRKLLEDSTMGGEYLTRSIGECLGIIGAIDPGRINLMNTSAEAKKFTPLDEIYIELLERLSNILESNPNYRLEVCYAIQECLRIFNIKLDDNKWERLPKNVQAQIKSMLLTRYLASNRSHGPTPDASSPIFQEDIEFHHWLSQLLLRLINSMENKNLRGVFLACWQVMANDINFCTFSMNMVFLTAFLDNNEELITINIVNEIKAIMYLNSDPEFTSSTQHPLIPSIESLSSLSDKKLKVRFRCAQVFFSFLNLLSQWRSYLTSSSSHDAQERRSSMKKIIFLRDSLNTSHLAELAFECRAYAQAIQLKEEFIISNPDKLQGSLESFQKYYISLGEVDAFEGFNAIRQNHLTIKDTIMNHRARHELHFSISCCEIACKDDPNDLVALKTLINSLIDLDQHYTVLNVLKSLDKDHNEWRKDLQPKMIEAALKLCSWDELDQLVGNSESCEDSKELHTGQLFKHLLDGNEERLKEVSRMIRTREVEPLAISLREQGAYVRGYEHLLQLHMINDIEKFSEIHLSELHQNLSQNFPMTDEESDSIASLQSSLEELFKGWRQRSELVQSSHKHKEPLLSIHRTLLTLGKSKAPTTLQNIYEREKAYLLLSSAKLARKESNLQLAYQRLVEVEDIVSKNKGLAEELMCKCVKERAKFEWNRGDQVSKENCVKFLEKKLEDPFFSSGDERRYAEIKLMYANYSKEMSHKDDKAIEKIYLDVVNKSPSWEKGFFCLAKHYERLHQRGKTLDIETRSKYLGCIVKNHGRSLKHGDKHVSESMPSLLYWWFILAEECTNLNKKQQLQVDPRSSTSTPRHLTSVMNHTLEITEFVRQLNGEISSHLFFIAFSQITSRICHPHELVRTVLVEILGKLLVDFPRQSMWYLVGMFIPPNDPDRQKSCQKIVQKAMKNDSAAQIIRATKKFAEGLSALCNHPVPKGGQSFFLTETRNLPDLCNFFKSDSDLSQVLLPLQELMSVRMRTEYESQESFSPFSNEQIYITGIENEVTTFTSMQAPKKVGFKCSDGKTRFMICKPKDDLRKDLQVMEFNRFINRLLKKNPEARKRNLFVKTFTAIPLSSAGGLVEFVENLETMRFALKTASKFLNRTPLSENAMCTRNNTRGRQDMLEKYKTECARNPPVLSAWFLHRFTDPTSWLMARLNYTRSTAVMCMVGYVIGLGDRHLDNILLNSNDGGVVHVDFNILFNQGELLHVPEIVPFRLTPNTIQAMGVTGYEGAFRRTCETTLSIMRENKDTLFSHLRPLVDDPIAEWKESPRHGRNTWSNSSAQKSKDLRKEILERIARIERRLEGKIEERENSSSISVNAQVQALIEL